jgi:hypothetical protein
VAAALVDRGVALELLDPSEARALLDSIDVSTRASTRTTQLYDRRRDAVSLDEIERITI